MNKLNSGICSILTSSMLIIILLSLSCCRNDSIKAGAARCEITPPVGYEIQHYYRYSIGVHDPLYAHCVYLEDKTGNSVAIICLDLIMGDYPACDNLRKEIREKTGIVNSLINFSHSHSSVALGVRGKTTISNDTGSVWNDKTLDAIVKIVKEARELAEPVSLRAGRAPVQVGFNRRLVDKKTGEVYMGDNREGAVVPWVNVLVAERKKTGKPVAVLFEHAAHPVIVPDSSRMISADFPGAATRRVCEMLGNDVIAIFGQGCCGNINGYPLRSTHENADQSGQILGDAVINAISTSSLIDADKLSIKYAQAVLPSAGLPDRKELSEMIKMNSSDTARMKQLSRIKTLLDKGEEPPSRRLGAWAVMLDREWCLVAMPHELFCDYELWLDKTAPFKHTMIFSFVNGHEGYIATDEALRLGPKGGYEAGSLPNWEGQVWGPQLGPPAVGCETIIKNVVSSLWKN